MTAITRLVQRAKCGTHLVSVPKEIVGTKTGLDLKAHFKWNTQANGWVMEITERTL
jgi:uncharacterized protein YfcZ (UPF0381/DUF406 family)